MKIIKNLIRKRGDLEKSLTQQDSLLKRLEIKTNTELGISSIDEVPKKYEFSNYDWNNGGSADVGLIGDNLVGKVIVKNIYEKPLSKYESIPYAISEYEKGKFFYENGISVPKPEGVYRVKNEKNEFIPAFVMENMKNYTELFELEGDEAEHVKELRDKELNKVKELGYRPDDAKRNNRNVLWNKEEDKICLIDFETWYKIPGR